MVFHEKLFKRGTVPVAPLMGLPGIHLTYTTVKENLENAEVQFETIKKLKERFEPDIVFPFMDLSVEAEALGLEIKKPDNESFSVKEHPIKSIEVLKQLSIPDPNSTRLSVFVETIKKMRQEFTDTPNAAYTIGPYSLAGLLSGTENTAMNTIMQPEFLHESLKFATKVIEVYGNALIEAGADCICILEPAGSLLSPQMFEEFAGNYIKELKESWSSPVFLHICGNTTNIIPKMLETGCDGLSLDTHVDLISIKENIPVNKLIIGNINPVATIAYGSKEDVEKEANALIEGMRDRKNFVLSSGCDIPADAKLDNIQAMFDVARKYDIGG